MIVLAIDPGPTESAWLTYDTETRHPEEWGKRENESLIDRMNDHMIGDATAIEMIASYGMAVGADVFQTALWVGRFFQRVRESSRPNPRLLYRREVKLHLCGSMQAKDANVRAALMDLYGGKDKAVGKKASPGPLYGIKADCWSALAIARTWADTKMHDRGQF